jgi:hypothetical protein
VTAPPLTPVDSRHNQWGQYLIRPPTGGKPVGYVRATTVAKALDDGGGLASWSAALTVAGLLARAGLRARWEALYAETDGNPWYYSDASKGECKRLVEECKAVGGANDRRDQGEALHSITALVDAGRTPKGLTPDTRRDVDAYRAGLAAAGIEVDREFIEQVVVLDELRIAGRFDRLVRIPGYDRLVVADLKCGADVSYSMQPFAVQLACYSLAGHRYQYGPAEDGSDDRRLAMPKVDRETGLIMHLPAGAARLELWQVDLKAGASALRLSLRARQWRQATPGGRYVGPTAEPPYRQGGSPDEPSWDLVFLQQRIAGLSDAQKLEASRLLKEEGVTTNPLKMSHADVERAIGLLERYRTEEEQ